MRIANDSVYGLAGRGVGLPGACARRRPTGCAPASSASTVRHSVGVMRRSAEQGRGIGRQNSLAGFDQYTEIKTVTYRPAGGDSSAAVRRSRGLRDPSTTWFTGDVRDPYTAELARRRARPCSVSTYGGCRTTRPSPSSSCTRHEEIAQQ